MKSWRWPWQRSKTHALTWRHGEYEFGAVWEDGPDLVYMTGIAASVYNIPWSLQAWVVDDVFKVPGEAFRGVTRGDFIASRELRGELANRHIFHIRHFNLPSEQA